MSNVVPLIPDPAPAPSVSTPPTRLLTTEDIAAMLQVSVNAIHVMRNRGDLPAGIKIGRRIRWRPETIDAWLAAQEEQ
ncbi:MAG: helix-turn-helix domain-containing protein [Gordonia sp. (in: high G+C Gram-positive bacteria)]